MRPALLLAALLPLPAFAQDLRVADPWTNAGEGDAAQVYMTLENTGDEPATLVGAEGWGAEIGTVVLGAADPVDEVPETLDGIAVSPGMEVVLRPGALHVRLQGIEGPLEEGATFPLTLLFEPQGAVEVEVQVEAADATAPSGG